MRKRVSGAMGAAVATAAFAMLTGQPLVASQSQTPTAGSTQAGRTSTGQSITVVGCVQREADYRRAVGAGRGGAVGTGVGTGNEFVLANAMMSTGSTSSATGTSGAGAAGTTGTTGSTTATSGTAYELTGSHEGEASTFVGRRVEIMGMLKPADSGTAGGPTANVPGSQDLKLRELEVSTIREMPGTCSAASSPSSTSPSTTSPSVPTP